MIEGSESAGVDFFEKIMTHISNTYLPCDNIADADLHLSTNEIYNKLQRLFPSGCYSASDVSQWMDKLKFYFTEIGNLNFEWLLKKKT